MTHGSLFSGIGGFDLAAEWMGWENVFHCEFNPFCQKILKQHFPNSIGYGDITTTDFTGWAGRIDIVTGGFPCQPYSQAGKRKGKADDRHLWPEMLRAIKQIQPTWVVGENVPGLLNWQRGMVLAEIKADLEAAGFEVFPPVILPACSVDAPHRRDRLWIIAYTNNKRCNNGSDIRSGGHIQGNVGATQKSKSEWEGREFGIGEVAEISTNADSIIGQQGVAKKQILGERNLQGLKSSGGFKDFSDRWDSPAPRTCGSNDGIPNRVDRIKALGNAIVPQVVFEIFKAIESINQP